LRVQVAALTDALTHAAAIGAQDASRRPETHRVTANPVLVAGRSVAANVPRSHRAADDEVRQHGE
jgi:hypothetical protein